MTYTEKPFIYKLICKNVELFLSNKGASSSTFTPSECFASQNERQKSTDIRYGASSSKFISSESLAKQNKSQKFSNIGHVASSNTFIPSESFASQNERQKSTDTRYGSYTDILTFF
nr:uncharacterized protein LOC124812167 [Hydra vulgaris]